MKKHRMLLAILLPSLLAVPANAKNGFRRGDEGYFSVAAFTSPESERAGVELSGIYMLKKDKLLHGLKLGAVFYHVGTDSGERSENFGGFSAAWHVQLDTPITPYVGIGVFAGETFHCQQYEDYCYDDYVIAAYPEVGIMLQTDVLQISPFIRRYFDTHGGESPSYTYGISLGIHF